MITIGLAYDEVVTAARLPGHHHSGARIVVE